MNMKTLLLFLVPALALLYVLALLIGSTRKIIIEPTNLTHRDEFDCYR